MLFQGKNNEANKNSLHPPTYHFCPFSLQSIPFTTFKRSKKLEWIYLMFLCWYGFVTIDFPFLEVLMF